MGIKRRYKRFRYYCSWRYPRLFNLAQKLAFPVQVTALCLALYSGVKFYQQNYSYEASVRAHRSEQFIASQTENPTALIEEIPTATSPDKVLAKANAVGDIQRQTGDNQTVAYKAPQNGNVLLPLDKETGPAFTPTLREVELLGSQWVVNQNNEDFVIQLAISDNEAKLKTYAATLPLSIPLAMYPYKRSRAGVVTYGLSAGLFSSSTEALSALPTLPKGLGEFGLWVRKIADIKIQISALNSNP